MFILKANVCCCFNKVSRFDEKIMRFFKVPIVYMECVEYNRTKIKSLFSLFLLFFSSQMVSPLYPSHISPSFMASLSNKSAFLQVPTINSQKPRHDVTPPTHCLYLTKSQFNWLHTTPLAQLRKLNTMVPQKKKPIGLITYYPTPEINASSTITQVVKRDDVYQVTVMDTQTGRVTIQQHSLPSFMLLFDGIATNIKRRNFELNNVISIPTTRRLLLPSPQERDPFFLDTPSYSDSEEDISSCSSYSIMHSSDDDDDCYYYEQESSHSLLELVQDTLNYIQSNGTYTEELRQLVPKLSDYLS